MEFLGLLGFAFFLFWAISVGCNTSNWLGSESTSVKLFVNVLVFMLLLIAGLALTLVF